MSIGLISSPATWLNGTVLPPSWAQTVQDNNNGWINGTGPTLKSLQIDGVGGAASATPAGNLAVSGSITSSTATSKSLWIPGGAWRDFATDYTYPFDFMSVKTVVNNASIRAMLVIPYSAGTTTITSVRFTLSKSSTTATRLSIFGGNAPNNLGSDTELSFQTTTTTGTAVQVTLSGLSLVVSDTAQYTIAHKSPSSGVVSDFLVGALVTYTSTVF